MANIDPKEFKQLHAIRIDGEDHLLLAIRPIHLIWILSWMFHDQLASLFPILDEFDLDCSNDNIPQEPFSDDVHSRQRCDPCIPYESYSRIFHRAWCRVPYETETKIADDK